MEQNKDYDKCLVTFQKYLYKKGHEFKARQQYKWLAKKFQAVTPTCGCTKGHYIYLIKEDARCCALKKPVWVPADYLIEEQTTHKWVTQTLDEESRGEGRDFSLPHDQRKNPLYYDKDGYAKVGT